MKKMLGLCRENSATILTGLGVAGVVSTAIMAAKDTPKALELLKEKDEYKMEKYGYHLTKTEKLLAMAPGYLPTILMGTATISCILGANRINKIEHASLVSAYTYLDSTFKEYRNKVKEIFGEEAEKKIVEELERERNLHEEYGDTSEIKLFYDEFSHRYFEMSMYELLKTIYDMNRMYSFEGVMSLNNVYEYLNMKPIPQGDELGWNAYLDYEKYGFAWIDIRWVPFETPDNLEAYAIRFVTDPIEDFDQE